MWRTGAIVYCLAMTVVIVMIAVVVDLPAIWLLALLFAVSFTLFLWQSERHVLRPLHRLQTTIERLHRGESSARIIPISQNEAGQLVHAFNVWQEQQREILLSLNAERNQLEAVFRSMADGVMIMSIGGTIQVANAAAARLFGVNEGEMQGSRFAEVVRHHELIALWQRCITENETVTGVVEITRANLFLEVSMTPVSAPGGSGHIVLLHDLTLVRRLDTVRRDFISNISHELRTPLASLQAVIETLQDGALDDPDAAQRFLLSAETEVAKLTQIVRELLELARIESGKVPLRLESVALESVIESAVERLGRQAERQEIRIDVKLEDNMPPILADAMRVEQVLINLLHNALKFSDGGSVVSVTAQRLGGRLQVCVSDTGVGISADAIERVFERFYKIDRARHSRGTGLGLAIAKHIVQAHGGEIWARSKVGRGSQFYFTLPLADSEVADAL